jgi:hypothetical protein
MRNIIGIIMIVIVFASTQSCASVDRRKDMLIPTFKIKTDFVLPQEWKDSVKGMVYGSHYGPDGKSWIDGDNNWIDCGDFSRALLKVLPENYKAYEFLSTSETDYRPQDPSWIAYTHRDGNPANDGPGWRHAQVCIMIENEIILIEPQGMRVLNSPNSGARWVGVAIKKYINYNSTGWFKQIHITNGTTTW